MTGRDIQLDDFMTAGRLRKILEQFPDDAPVLIQRIEDKFFTTPNSEYAQTTAKYPNREYPEYEDEYIQVYGVVVYEGDDSVYLTPSYTNRQDQYVDYKVKGFIKT